VAKAKTTTEKLGLTRGKAVLIGVLGAALIGVLYVQLGGASGEEEFGLVTPVTLQTPVERPLVPKAGKKTEDAEVASDTNESVLKFDQTKWQVPEVSKVIAYDPFALPAAFPQPARMVGDVDNASGQTEVLTAEDASKQRADALEELRTQLDELKQRGVHVIIGQKNDYVAWIGDRMVHVGDDINGFTVTDIDPEGGVRVELKGPQ
jgi:hypothetical protein